MERRSEPRDVNDILAAIMSDLKVRKEENEANDRTRESNKECEQQTN